MGERRKRSCKKPADGPWKPGGGQTPRPRRLKGQRGATEGRKPGARRSCFLCLRRWVRSSREKVNQKKAKKTPEWAEGRCRGVKKPTKEAKKAKNSIPKLKKNETSDFKKETKYP